MTVSLILLLWVNLDFSLPLWAKVNQFGCYSQLWNIRVSTNFMVWNTLLLQGKVRLNELKLLVK